MSMLIDRSEEVFVFDCCLQTDSVHYEKLLYKVLQFLKPHHFASPYRRKVYQRLCSFFDQFRRPPTLQELKDYCLSREKNQQMKEGMEAVLNAVSHIDITNIDYIADKILFFARKSNLVRLVDEIISNLNKGNVQQAETLVRNFAEVSSDTDQFCTFKEMIPQYIEMMEGKDDEDSLTFTYGGLLNELIGPLHPGWLVGVLAPTKRGKTWFLIYTALTAVCSRLRTYFVSLEMPLNQVIRRFVRMYFGCEGTEDWIVVPDCKLNQEGICTRPERTSPVGLKERGKLPSSYEDTPRDYQPCTACREKKDSNFALSGWKVRNFEKKEVDLKSRLSKLDWFVKLYGGYARIRSYPAYSARVWDILGDVNVLESDGFIPNMIVIDYADLLVASSRYVEYRHQLDEIWKGLKRLAVEKNCIVVTASQSTRASIGKDLLDVVDVAEDIRKVAHCDVMIGLNQTDEERMTSILRINVIAKREGFFDPRKQLKCLTDFSCGRLIVDESWQ